MTIEEIEFNIIVLTRFIDILREDKLKMQKYLKDNLKNLDDYIINEIVEKIESNEFLIELESEKLAELIEAKNTTR